MKTSAIVAISAASTMCSAFVPPSAFNGKALVTPAKSSSSQLQMGADTLVGGRPFGAGSLFDPLNLASKATPIQLKKWQESEVKHGRIAMLASVGFLLQEHFHPLFPVQDKELGPALTHFQHISESVPWFWALAVFAIGIFEGDNIYRGWVKQDVSKGIAELKENYTVGDLGFDPLQFASGPNADKFEEFRTKELNNGRLAMIAIIGMWGQELATGGPIF